MQKTIKPYALAKLHADILMLSFRHRKELSAKFRDVLGLLFLDYISIEIANPEGEYVFFSALPAVNFNLIENHLWPYDGAMSPSFYQQKTFFTWQSAYQPVFATELKAMKEIAFGFHYGFTLVRKINHFYLMYSFATKNTDPDIKPFYAERLDEILKIGDYCYKMIRPLYLPYCQQHMPPALTYFRPFVAGVPREMAANATHLKLVVNN